MAKISGAVRARHPGKTVHLQRYRDGAWRNVTFDALDAQSRYAFGLGTANRGTYRYRVTKAGDTDHLRGVSRARSLTVE